MVKGNGETPGKAAVLNPDIRMLDARQVQVTRDAFDRVKLVIGEEETHEKVKLARAFPLTRPDQYLSFLTEEGKEIGMLPELKRLDSTSQRVIQEELELAYFTPVIEKIHSVDSQHGSTTWVMATDRGAATVHVKDRGDVRRLPGRRIIFTDVHGMKYDLPDYSKLDDRSRTLLENEI